MGHSYEKLSFFSVCLLGVISEYMERGKTYFMVSLDCCLHFFPFSKLLRDTEMRKFELSTKS